MKISQALLVVVLAVVTTLVTGLFVPGKGPSSEGVSHVTRESAYARVMRTSTLRCGYMIYPKFVERDPNTGAFSGLYVDLMEEIGKKLSVKIEWTEEVGAASAFEGLKTGRYDVACIPFTATPERARETMFTAPVIYIPYYIFARADDTRFDNAYDKINDLSVRYVYLEGELSQFLRVSRFPKTQPIALPNLTDVSQTLLNVAMGKADIATTEPSTAEPFLTNNPGKLKRVPGPPLTMDPTGLDIALGEHDLMALLNSAIHTLFVNGTTEKIVSKHTTGPDQFFLPAQPWGNSALPAAKP